MTARPGRHLGGALLLLFAAALHSGAQQPAAEAVPQPKAQVSFQFLHKGLPIPQYTLTVDEDGAGTYTATDNSRGASEPIQRDLTLTAATTRKIFALSLAAHLSQATCASRAKNIADTGTKTLTYVAAEGTSTCTYNYSENKEVVGLTDVFQGIAQTMDEGRRLDFLHRFDRLGLDDAMAYLVEEVSTGRALEVGTIAPSLRSIVEDSNVLQRVRAKAAVLLAQVPANSASR